MDACRADTSAEIAAAAARLVVEEGLEYAGAKRRAGKLLGLSSRAPWPDNQTMDAAVREYIAIFCPQEQATELRALRELAVSWMDRLAQFRPHIGGAVWHGTATRHSDIYLDLYCDDPKSAEWALLDHQVEYHPGSSRSRHGTEVEALTLRVRCPDLGQWVLVHLLVHDLNGVRGALKPDAQGRKLRGDLSALQVLMAADGTEIP